MSTLPELIDQSNVVTPERKKIYQQILKFMKPESHAQLVSILTEESEMKQKVEDEKMNDIAEENKKYLEKLDKLVSDGLKIAQATQEGDEMENADILLEQLNNFKK